MVKVHIISHLGTLVIELSPLYRFVCTRWKEVILGGRTYHLCNVSSVARSSHLLFAFDTHCLYWPARLQHHWTLPLDLCERFSFILNCFSGEKALSEAVSPLKPANADFISRLCSESVVKRKKLANYAVGGEKWRENFLHSRQSSENALNLKLMKLCTASKSEECQIQNSKCLTWEDPLSGSHYVVVPLHFDAQMNHEEHSDVHDNALDK